MKTQLVRSIFLFAVLFLAPLQYAVGQKQPSSQQIQDVTYKVVKLTNQETAVITGQGESSRISKQIEDYGYAKGKAIVTEKYIGKDKKGSFEVITIELSFQSKTKGKSNMTTYIFQAKRETQMIGQKIIVFDDESEYKAGEKKLQRINGNNSKLSDCFPKFIAAFGSCSSLANSIKTCTNNCPKNKKGKPNLFCAIGCVFSNSAKVKGCINDVVGLANCIVSNW